MSIQSERIKDYLPFAERLLAETISTQSLKITKHAISKMGEWHVDFENDEFILQIDQDRMGYTNIALGSKLRKKPNDGGLWSMSHLKGFIDGSHDHYLFSTTAQEASWLKNNDKTLFDSNLLNSDALNKWAVIASRRLFGQK